MVILSPEGKPLENVLCMTTSSNLLIGISNKQGQVNLAPNHGSCHFHHLNFYDTTLSYVNLPDTLCLRPKSEHLSEAIVTRNLPNPKKHFQSIFKKSAETYEAYRSDIHYYSHYEKTKIGEDSIYFSIPCLAISYLNGSYSNSKINTQLFQPIAIFLSTEIETTKTSFEQEVLAYYLLKNSLIYPKFYGTFFFLNHDIKRTIIDDQMLFIITNSKKTLSYRDYWTFKVDKSNGLITEVIRKAIRVKDSDLSIHYTYHQKYSKQEMDYALNSATYVNKTLIKGKTIETKKGEWSWTDCSKNIKQDSLSFPWLFATYGQLFNNPNTFLKKPKYP